MPAAVVAEVSKPDELTPELFEREFVRPARPIVIRGLASDFAARSWDFPRIAPHFPKRALRATGVSHGLRETWHFTSEELAERLSSDVVAADTPRADWLFDVRADLPELLSSLPPPAVSRGATQYRLFMGRSTVTPGHYHSFQHALLCAIHGTKRVLLYTPEDSGKLYPEPMKPEDRHYRSSQVDFATPDLARFPLFASARPLEVTLAPGDALFVPVHFWHAVYGTGPVMSTSLFWNARLRDYRFPQPGFSTLAGVVRAELARGLRGFSKLAARSTSL
ncbi:MAG TPA: cupin-like domain-containing protein [Polyangiaceae bacterium]|jgi:hypothetical protein|nr:cupin-like domain-containing protein [Polyangiaceae bacterium]